MGYYYLQGSEFSPLSLATRYLYLSAWLQPHNLIRALNCTNSAGIYGSGSIPSMTCGLLVDSIPRGGSVVERNWSQHSQ